MSSDSSAASSPSASPETSRRRVLAFLGAGAAAAFASLFSRDDAQAGHDGTNVLHIGETNVAPAGATTSLLTDVPGSGQTGIMVHNPNGQAITGLSSDGIGVFGSCDTGQGGQFHSSSGRGVSGFCPSGPGVQGNSESGPGVQGISGTGIGVEARSTGGLALRVDGTAAFSTAGSAVIPAGEQSAFVANSAVTAASHISVTAVSDPAGRVVEWVERNPGSGFTVHLSPAVRRRKPETALTYLIVEPG